MVSGGRFSCCPSLRNYRIIQTLFIGMAGAAGVSARQEITIEGFSVPHGPLKNTLSFIERHEYLQELDALMARRREELDQLRKLGIEPYPYGFERDAFSSDILSAFKDGIPQWINGVAGRIMSLRKMGKASFCHIQDSKGKIQIYLKKDDLGDIY